MLNHHQQFNLTHITKNPIILVSVVMSVVGWFIAFIGTCILGRGAGGFWWTIIFELLLIGGILFSAFKKVFHHYKLMFMIFLGVSIALLTQALNGLIYSYSPGAQVAGAGAVIVIVMQFFWVILFGSTEDSAVYKFVYSGFTSPVSPNNNGVVAGVGNFISPRESKIALSSPEASSQYSHHHQQSITSVHTPIQNTIPPPAPTNALNNVNQQQQQQPQKIMATALHPYQANPEDPNELSFAKDEVLEVLNKSGNWWQAKKQDGTIGIVPSNYFSP